MQAVFIHLTLIPGIIDMKVFEFGMHIFVCYAVFLLDVNIIEMIVPATQRLFD